MCGESNNICSLMERMLLPFPPKPTNELRRSKRSNKKGLGNGENSLIDLVQSWVLFLDSENSQQVVA